MNELDFARNEIAKLHDDIHELTAERDALRAELSKQQALTEASQRVTEVAQYRADALRARVDEMEKQEPVAWGCTVLQVDGSWKEEIGIEEPPKDYFSIRNAFPLYALPGAQAQPAPSKQDASVRKAWARFSHELHRSPDAPYPGMADAFEQHFSQSFTDREWMAEASTWAAAWKAAKRHGAQSTPSVPGDIMRDAMRYRFLRSARNIPISTKAARDPVVYDEALDAAMLAAAAEAKS